MDPREATKQDVVDRFRIDRLEERWLELAAEAESG